jgi:hypothetical protein
MMHLKSSGITGKFIELPEALIASFFSAVAAGFEAYGSALCGHVASACPTEPEPSRIESKPVAIRIGEPETKTFAVVVSHSNRKFSRLPECQL